MIDESGEFLDALTRRLLRSCKTRCSSTMSQGRTGARSTSTLFLYPSRRNASLAWPTRHSTYVYEVYAANPTKDSEQAAQSMFRL